MRFKKPIQKLIWTKMSDVKINRNGGSRAAGFEAVLREVVAPAKLPTPSADFETDLMAELDLEPQAEPEAGLLSRLGWILPVVVSIAAALYFVNDVRWFIYRGAMRFTAFLTEIVIRLDTFIGKVTVYAAGESSRGIGGLLNGSLGGDSMSSLLLINIILVSIVILSAVVAVKVINER